MTLGAALMLAHLAAVPEPAVEQGPKLNGLSKSGLYGWGLGVELPMVGVTTGGAEKSQLGWGFTMGGAVDYQLTPHLEARLGGTYGHTYGGRARVRYLTNVSAGTRTYQVEDAEWLGGELLAGGAYLWRDTDSAWTPYVGGDVGMTFSGYYLHFDESLKNIEAVDLGDTCVGAACRSDIHDGLAFRWIAGVRGGMRLELIEWLATQAELQVLYTRTGQEPVSNTVESRDVRTARENVLLVRATFSIRLGL